MRQCILRGSEGPSSMMHSVKCNTIDNIAAGREVSMPVGRHCGFLYSCLSKNGYWIQEWFQGGLLY